MRIGIDACCWSNRRGFGRYTRELVGRMVGEAPNHEFLLFVDQHTAQRSELPANATIRVVETDQQPTQAASADGSRSPMDLWRMRRAVSHSPLDVFFFPAVYSFFPIKRCIPAVVTFHDATAENHPSMIFRSLRTRLFWNVKSWLALRNATRLLTVSEAAKAQIIQTFSYPEAKIRVVLEGPGREFKVLDDREFVEDVRREYKLPPEAPLILYVGGISPHKNLQGLIRALKLTGQFSDIPWHMVMVGDYENDSFLGCYGELKQLCLELGLEQRITFTGFVPNETLVRLYNASTLFVLPSLSEGFGLPVVEAMACGLPVAASNCGSLPEVLASAGILFDPTQPRGIAKAIVRLLCDGALRQKLRLAGLKRSREFCWTTAARKVVQILEEATNGKFSGP
jgi:glycosyltransferase involved in cell wall biosynthesis